MSEETEGPEGEIAAIQHTMKHDNRAYRSDRVMQDRYLELLKTREATASPEPAEASEADTEIAAIQHRIKHDNRGYLGDQEMQARYLELLKERTGEAGPAEHRLTEPSALGIEGLPSPAEMTTNLRENGLGLTADALSADGRDIRQTAPAVQFAVMQIAKDIGTEDGAHQFADSFGLLPARAQANAVDALLSYSDGERTGPPRPGAKSRDFSAAILKEWGDDASFHAGILSARWEKIYAGLTADETKLVDHFLLSAPEAEWDAIVRQLSSSEALHKRSDFKQAMQGAR